jgi:hypothetical protein
MSHINYDTIKYPITKPVKNGSKTGQKRVKNPVIFVVIFRGPLVELNLLMQTLLKESLT